MKRIYLVRTISKWTYTTSTLRNMSINSDGLVSPLLISATRPSHTSKYSVKLAACRCRRAPPLFPPPRCAKISTHPPCTHTYTLQVLSCASPSIHTLHYARYTRYSLYRTYTLTNLSTWKGGLLLIQFSSVRFGSVRFNLFYTSIHTPYTVFTSVRVEVG